MYQYLRSNMVAEAGLETTPCCGARYNLRACAFPRFYRPLPLARLPFSATGGGRLAPLREPGGRLESFFITKENTTQTGGVFFGCGGRTRTYDLRVMSPTSFQLLYSAIWVRSLECLHIVARREAFVNPYCIRFLAFYSDRGHSPGAFAFFDISCYNHYTFPGFS